jgi:hypothetical protein
MILPEFLDHDHQTCDQAGRRQDVAFHQARRWAEPLRLAQELLIAGLAALALLAVGERALGWALALLTVIHHALVYALGERLIKHKH